MRYVEIIIILVFLGIILASFNMIYGQSPAQSEVNNETGYRAELESYINLHNISFDNANVGVKLNISYNDVHDLETAVKSHMEFCQSQNNMDERIRSKQIRGTEWAIRVHRQLAYGDC